MIKIEHREYNRPISKTKRIINTVIRTILRNFLGLVFVFSGFVKIIDPLGYTYKLEEYISLLGNLSEILQPTAFPLAVLISIFELVLGLCFIFNVKSKLTIKASFLFIIIMLPLTLFLAVTNKISDCGCFGDAVVLSNWETFYKNVVIIVAIILLWIVSKRQNPIFYQHIEWAFISVFLTVAIILSVYNYRHLPIIDFRPYKVGINIPESMIIPEGKQSDRYETTLVYAKDGEQKEFTIDNYPKGDDWVFVNQKTVLVEKGYTPPIHDFLILGNNGDDLTDVILDYNGTVNIIVMYDLKKADEKGIEQTKRLYELWKNKGTPFIALTGSTSQDINKFRLKYHVKFPILNTDQITLKTVVRANPGLIVLNKGTILGKWHWRDFFYN